MTTEYEDGAQLLDAFEAPIATQDYIFNDWSVTPATLMAERNDEKGRLAAKRNLDDPGRDTATATIQISVSAMNQKLTHETFICPAGAHYDGNATTYVIESETAPVTVNESRIRTITCRRILTQP
jgi:hypothetical protein